MQILLFLQHFHREAEDEVVVTEAEEVGYLIDNNQTNRYWSGQKSSGKKGIYTVRSITKHMLKP